MKFKPTLAAMAAALLSACGSVSIETEGRWTQPSAQGKTYEHILIVGIAADPGTRGVVEKGFAEGMSDSGLTVTAGADLMPPSGRITKEMVLRYTDNTDIDAVISILPLNYEVDHVDRGRYYAGPRMAWNSTAYGMDVMLGTAGPTPGGTLTLRYNFFDLADEQLIWTADTVVQNPGSIDRLIRKGHAELSRNLKDAGLIR